MSFRVELHPEALLELKKSYLWYEERSAGLGDRFISWVNKRISQIAQDPERYPKKKGNYREVGTDIFPYTIIYEVIKKENVVIISYIFHTKRNPRLKFKR